MPLGLEVGAWVGLGLGAEGESDGGGVEVQVKVGGGGEGVEAKLTVKFGGWKSTSSWKRRVRLTLMMG